MHIDLWTLALQTINALVLIWLLGRFFFQPVRNIVVKRQQEIEKQLSDAQAARDEIAKLRSDASKEREEIAAERNRLIAETHRAAQQEHASLLAQAAQEIEKRREDAKAVIAHEKEEAHKSLVEQASKLSLDIARRLIERLPADVVSSAFCEGLCEAVHALPMQEKKDLISTSDHAVTVAASQPISAEDEAQLREALKGAGVTCALVFEVDKTLIAGLELRSRNLIVRNNWHADLEQIRKELGHGQGSH